jgi:hypothetical protein
MRSKILWVEDQTSEDLVELAACVYATGKYDLVVAGDATEAIRQLIRSEYDAVVVDVRIPPGIHPVWTRLFNKRGEDKTSARLGLAVLQSVLRPERAPVSLGLQVPTWIPQGNFRFGMLTVEARVDFATELEELGVLVYRQKTVETHRTVLLEVIEEILRMSQGTRRA